MYAFIYIVFRESGADTGIILDGELFPFYQNAHEVVISYKNQPKGEKVPNCTLLYPLLQRETIVPLTSSAIRFALCDFPLHLPLELLGVETTIQVIRS